MVSPQLLDLPDELLLQIVSHLDPSSVIPLHSTCKRLRSLTRSDPTLWRNLCASQAILDSTAAEAYTHFSRTDELAVVIDSWPYTDVDWYSEYKFRHAPLSTRWLSPLEDEVKGLAAITTNNTHKHLLISPLEDGAVSIWSPSTGENVARSSAGVLHTPLPPASRKSRIAELGDNAVASAELDRIYVASDSTLIELSLTTLQVVSKTKFPFSISTLNNQVVLPHPLTVGTTLTLHLHDPRTPHIAASADLPENYTLHAPLFQPSPLAILHHPNDSLFVAGRFPSILCYDRAMWPKLKGALFSGGSLCTLAADGMHGLIAGGTYNGRGTLEAYDLLSGSKEARQKNRQSAAWGKILSVAKQGTRVVSCDSEGTISWFERDCRYVVRREEVFDPDAGPPQGTLWSSATDEGCGPVRKVAVMDSEDGVEEGLGVWAGERVGVLAPVKEEKDVDELDDDLVLVESREDIIESEMAERMRLALHAHANELRILGSLAGLA
ncbi:hypothetical protein FN846DRAFT_788470 [Sphaerosporella brunnea]|uniref:F-box domain-containing protein n=1 Tax=Sphaerosporella brunnea TaxID=1250544 RepID=A0A5J5EE69_9PEZI|nr:hypothetical protein FN846DRAFT_788470 [Sphaerosporella brunnea]